MSDGYRTPDEQRAIAEQGLQRRLAVSSHVATNYPRAVLEGFGAGADEDEDRP